MTRYSVLGVKAVTKTASFAISAQPTDAIYLVDATAGAVVVTLPAAGAVVKGGISPILYVKKIDAVANAVTITPAAGTIDGAATKATSTQYEGFVICSDGTNWHIIAKN